MTEAIITAKAENLARRLIQENGPEETERIALVMLAEDLAPYGIDLWSGVLHEANEARRLAV